MYCKSITKNRITAYLLSFYLSLSLSMARLGCWTEWFDRDNPWPWYWGNGDTETLPQLRAENPGKICPNPYAIEVTTTNGISAALTGEVFAA